MPTRRFCLSLFLAAFLAAAARAQPATEPATGPTTLPAADPAVVVEHAVRALVAGDYDAFAEVAALKVRRLVTPDKLRQLGSALTVKYGPFEGTGEPAVTAERNGASGVVVAAFFERQAVTFTANVGADGRIGGFFITNLTPRGEAVPLAEYVSPDRFTESQVVVRTPRGERPAVELPGTLSMPVGDGPFPAVVLVHGSGPSDRDETVGGTQVFRDLAGGLASRGVAVLRYEKRTRVHPEVVDLRQNSLANETIDDAVSGLELLRGRKRVDSKRLFVLGHSLGGMLGPQIVEADANQNRNDWWPPVAGLILAAAPARPMMDVLVGQIDFLARLDGKVTPQEQEQLDAAVAATVAVRNGDVHNDAELLGVPLDYWKQLDAVRPTDDLASVMRADPSLRVLIVRGDRDYQVTAADWAAWRAATAGEARAASRQYPSLNHLFVARTGRPGPAEYEQIGHVAGLFVTDLAEWITAGALPPPTTEPADVPKPAATQPAGDIGQTDDEE